MKQLLKDFYELIATEYDEKSTQIKSEIKLNKTHPVYQGHFPGMPVTPGVCQVQIITEVLSNQLKKKLHLQSAQNIKFLAIINPIENDLYTLTIDFSEQGDRLSVNASFAHEGKTYLKFKGQFTASQVL